jgi:aspartate/methionine/tyrosine aminotransferase
MAGWRVGAVVGEKEIIDNILTYKSNMDSGMFKPIQEAACIALGLGNEWINSLNDQYNERKKVACTIFDELNIEFESDGAGLFVWGKIPNSRLDSDAFSNELLTQTRVFITPGHIFGDQGNQYLRISLCSTLDDMNDALKRIKQSFKLEASIINDQILSR